MRVAARGFALLATLLACSAAPPAAPTDHTETIALDAAPAGHTYRGLPLGLVQTGSPAVTPVDGRIGVVAISMSNGRMEFERYIELYAGHPEVAPQVVPVNCARGSNALESWLTKPELWHDCRDSIAAAGLRPDQVRVVWAKNANQFTAHGRTLPDPDADYYALVANIEALVDRIRQQLPSVQAIYHTSRSYGGYVAEDRQAARGEPISYEGGHAINSVLRRWQEDGEPGPWMGWGPYIWADGPRPNGSGLTWHPGDFMEGGTDPHPTMLGRKKVADALHTRWKQDAWYVP